MPKARTSRWLIFATLLLFATLWAAWAWWSDRNYRAAIMSVELHMANGRFGLAARDLTKLLSQSANTGEAALLLGRCEQERGRLKAAAEALALVPPGSELSHKATLARMRLLHDQGQISAAEQLITEIALDPRNDKAHVRVLLVPIYSQLGRSRECQQLLEDWWRQLDHKGQGASEPAIDQLRMHIELALKPNPITNVRAYLDQASQLNPNDDRIWLGRANLAIRAGNHQEARSWLDACLKRRPHDIPVWSAYLALGLANNQLPLVLEAMNNLPADALSSAQICELDAWLSAHRGNSESEKHALERLLAVSPAHQKALTRLIELAQSSGPASRIPDLHNQKAEAERRAARYEKLFDRNQPLRDAEEMAQLAIQLGRPFEAQAFLTIELAQDPNRSDLRQQLVRLESEHKPPQYPAAARTLAQVLSTPTPQ